MNTHFIHRPTPPGGETDGRFRELTVEIIQGHVAEVWRNGDWRRQYHNNYGVVWGTIWRIPGSDAPSAELLELAKGVG
jgi:hypothetical protein